MIQLYFHSLMTWIKLSFSYFIGWNTGFPQQKVLIVLSLPPLPILDTFCANTCWLLVGGNEKCSEQKILTVSLMDCERGKETSECASWTSNILSWQETILELWCLKYGRYEYQIFTYWCRNENN